MWRNDGSEEVVVAAGALLFVNSKDWIINQHTHTHTHTHGKINWNDNREDKGFFQSFSLCFFSFCSCIENHLENEVESWVGEGVIKWANTKFMAKMATKKKGGSRGTHTHNKVNWRNPKKKWRAAWKGQRWTYVYNTRLNQLFLFGRGNQGTTILNFKKRINYSIFQEQARTELSNWQELEKGGTRGVWRSRNQKKILIMGGWDPTCVTKRGATDHFISNTIFSRIKFSSISNFKSVARYVTPLFLEGRENKKCSKEEKHTNKQNTDKNIWLALHRR